MDYTVENIITKSEYDIINFLKNNTDFNIYSKDNNGNYFIQLLIIKNYFIVFNFILKNKDNIELDILDEDNRPITYYIVKYNRINFIDSIIMFFDKIIGFPIFDIKDNEGDFSLSYSILFSNNQIFFKLYNSNKTDIFKNNNKGESILHLAIKKNNNEIINFLLANNYPTNLINNNNESISHYFITFYYSFPNIINLFKNMNLNFKEKIFGLTTLHLIAINHPNLLLKLDDLNHDLNNVDYYGNTPINYLLVEKHYTIFENIFLKYSKFIDYKNLNINGDTILHLYLYNNKINTKTLQFIIQNSNLNIQNNQGNTPIHIFNNNNLDITLLKNTLFNIFILNNKGKNAIDYSTNKKQFIQIVSQYFFDYLINNKFLAKEKWEKECSKSNNCKNIIFKYLSEDKKNPPFTYTDDRKVILDNNLPVKQCQYAGISLDILFGLIFIKKQLNTNIILEYPLTVNTQLTQYFKTFGIDLDYKIDFINIQIYWAYQQLIMPSFLTTEKDYKNIIKSSGFTIIPLGIEIENGGHANIIIFDHNKKTIERFEPQGSNPPMDFNYNPNKLDQTLQNKFKIIDYKYITPDKYLPPVGFQFLETLEKHTCNIGDPNGFCAVWCIWWAYHKIINNIDSKILVDKLIHKIKLGNYSFKNIIRNFSSKITDIRDKYLKNIDLDINLWIQGKYDKTHIDKLINNLNL